MTPHSDDVIKRLDRLQRTVDKLVRARAAGADTVVEVDYPGAVIELRVSGRHERKRAQACRKEPWTVEWIESAPPDSVLWDLGANVGAYSLIAAKRPGPLSVVSIEPSYSTYASLCANVVLNDAGDRVTPLCLMVGDRTGIGTLGYADLSPGASFHAGGAPSLAGSFRSQFDQKVLVVTIDDLVARFGLPEPDYLKVDVDGAETKVLHGATGTLNRVRSVLLEISNREQLAIAPLMEAAGLRRREHEHRRRDDPLDENESSVGYVIYDRAG